MRVKAGRGRTTAAIPAATPAARGGGVAESASRQRRSGAAARQMGRAMTTCHERPLSAGAERSISAQWIARVIGHVAARGAISGRREAGGRGAQVSRLP